MFQHPLFTAIYFLFSLKYLYFLFSSFLYRNKKMDNKHYDYWSSQMETIFISQDLCSLVDEGYGEPPQIGTASS
jgi:hypothetical protein